MTGDVSPSPRPERRGSPTRGFLFADLRGYTTFVERHGAHRAAAMLDRYRTLVRAAVADFDGAEIRTEGDSFYVVFDGASAAIECGLAVVAAASEAAETDPATAFKVGVGIHAGETVETAEGYVGSAVNTAARICARAGPNQVLVSGTVRALTAGVVDASFVPVGRRRLKGLLDPIELYRVEPGPAAPDARPTIALLPGRRAGLVALGALTLAGLLVAAIARPGFGPASAEPGAGSESPAPASGLLADDASPSTGAGSPSAAALASVSAAPDAFPNAVESKLMTILIPEPDWDRCERAPEADAPVLDLTSITQAPAGGGQVVQRYRQKVSTFGGIVCHLGGISGPDAVWYWRLGDRSEGAQYIAEHGPKVNAVSGSCATEEAAIERWRFGGGSGSLLCYATETGDAVLSWTYDQTNVFGHAIRDDRNAAALLDWWTDEARFLPESP